MPRVKQRPERIIVIVRRLHEAYGIPEWRPHRDPLAELILTILSQNTSDSNSGRAFARLLERFATWDEVAEAPLPELIAAIQPGGLAPTKAPRIQAVLGEVRERTGGYDLAFLADLPVEEARAWLAGLHGVGPKTVACVLMFALGMPAMPVDTHVFRVSMRLGLIAERVAAAPRANGKEQAAAPRANSRQQTPKGREQAAAPRAKGKRQAATGEERGRTAAMTAEKAHALLEAMVPPEEYYAFHIGLIKHGRRTCTAQRPACGRCVLADVCPSAGLFE